MKASCVSTTSQSQVLTNAHAVRANAFHLNAHSGLVRIVHFGNRAVSLEQFGVPSAFVLRADAFEEVKKLKVKEALCYLGARAIIRHRGCRED